MLHVFRVYQWYQWYTNVVQGSINGTVGKSIGTNGNANGIIGSPNGIIGSIGKAMVPSLSQWYHCLPLVKLPMVPLGNPEQSPYLKILARTRRYLWKTLSVLMGDTVAKDYVFH